MGLGLCLLFTYSPANQADPQGPGQPWKTWAHWLSRCLASCHLSVSITKWRAEQLLYIVVPCQEIWGPLRCGRYHPFFHKKDVVSQEPVSSRLKLCLVILPHKAPWGVQPWEINHPDQWAELPFPSAQGEECIFSLCFSPRLYHNKNQSDNIKGTSSQCHLVPVLLEWKASRRHSGSKSVKVPWTAFWNCLSSSTDSRQAFGKLASEVSLEWRRKLAFVNTSVAWPPFPSHPGILKPWSHQSWWKYGTEILKGTKHLCLN